MPRIRSIKPEIWMSPQVMNLSHSARLLFIGLISQADDEGRGTADPRKLKAAIFPGDDDIGSARVLELLTEVEVQTLCTTYDGNGHGRVYALPSFSEHQYIQRPKPSVYPKPPKQPLARVSRNGIGTISDAADTHIGGSDRIGRIGSEGSDRIVPEEENPLTPLQRGNEGAGAPSVRRARSIRSASREAWNRVLAAAQSGANSVGDGEIDEAVRLMGGYGRLGQAHIAQRQQNRERFRESYESLLDRREMAALVRSNESSAVHEPTPVPPLAAATKLLGPPKKTREQLERDALKLAQAGVSTVDIAHSLSQYGVTVPEVAHWLANAPPPPETPEGLSP